MNTNPIIATTNRNQSVTLKYADTGYEWYEEAARKAQEEAAAEMERARQELRNKPMDMTVGMYMDLLDEIKSLKEQVAELKLDIESS